MFFGSMSVNLLSSIINSYKETGLCVKNHYLYVIDTGHVRRSLDRSGSIRIYRDRSWLFFIDPDTNGHGSNQWKTKHGHEKHFYLSFRIKNHDLTRPLLINYSTDLYLYRSANILIHTDYITAIWSLDKNIAIIKSENSKILSNVFHLTRQLNHH